MGNPVKFCISILVLAALAVILLKSTGEARQFSKCSLAKSLLAQGFKRADLQNWVCLVQNESRMKTDAMNYVNSDGSWDWGLFQINDRYWCDPKDKRKSSNGCKVKCADLASEDITAAGKCAKLIYNIHGFQAWVAWINKCQYGSLPDLSDCDL